MFAHRVRSPAETRLPHRLRLMHRSGNYSSKGDKLKDETVLGAGDFLPRPLQVTDQMVLAVDLVESGQKCA